MLEPGERARWRRLPESGRWSLVSHEHFPLIMSRSDSCGFPVTYVSAVPQVLGDEDGRHAAAPQLVANGMPLGQVVLRRSR
jgi:hypothetical protein